jgi:hypothetical protein
MGMYVISQACANALLYIYKPVLISIPPPVTDAMPTHSPVKYQANMPATKATFPF